MQRIVVIGAGGAGKTVLANRLGRILGLPVTHLDALRYCAACGTGAAGIPTASTTGSHGRS